MFTVQQNNLPINCNIHVYDLLIPLVQCLKCAQIVRNSSKLKRAGQLRLSQVFFFFSQKKKEMRFRWRSNLTHYRRLCC